MVCQVCKEAGVLSHANWEHFWYCRNCKIEIFPEIIYQNVFELEPDYIQLLEIEEPEK